VDALLESAPGADDDTVYADSAMIAAGMILHEIRLFAGAPITRSDAEPAATEEVFPMAPICRLPLPALPPGERSPESSLCVGAGGVGGALCLFGLGPGAGAGDELILVDGDTVEPHNLLLHQHAGAPKVTALAEELRRMGARLRVQTIPQMITPGYRFPRGEDVLYAVTDSARSRLLAQDAFFAERVARSAGRGQTMVSAGSSLGGAEGFFVGGSGDAACIRCRLPLAEEEGTGQGACSHRPATFASNLIAAGLSLALSRRRRLADFLSSPPGLSRFLVTTQRAERACTYLPQSCRHLRAEPSS